MRYLAILLTTLVLASCSTAQVTRGESLSVSSAPRPAPAPQTEADSVVQFLLTAAATDFHTQRPSDPGRFRDVRLGHIMVPSGEAQWMLCGQFLSPNSGGRAEWKHFATIKTSGYEQLIGAQAAGLCQDSSLIWAQRSDLSSSLQRRLESLR